MLHSSNMLSPKAWVCLETSIKMRFRKCGLKLEKIRPKTCLKLIHLVHDNAAAQNPSTVAHFFSWKSIVMPSI